MKLANHQNHRNSKYLNWLRGQSCAISAQKAECAHHVRLGTNGGTSLKPSDYFCIPLINEYHTTGPFALHIIGEESFFTRFNLTAEELFLYYLTKYAAEKFDLKLDIHQLEVHEAIAVVIAGIEEKDISVTKVRAKTKKEKPEKAPTQSLKGDPYYEKSKELKRAHDKKLRDELKKNKVKVKVPKTEFQEKMKEAKKLQDRERRLKNKEVQSEYRKAQYKKLKALKEKRD